MEWTRNAAPAVRAHRDDVPFGQVLQRGDDPWRSDDPGTGRVPSALALELPLEDVHIAWAGSMVSGRPHYHRLQGPRFLAEWDNTQRDANHGHSVWRDPTNDFGLDVLAAHRRTHH